MDKANVVRGKFSSKRELHFTDAKIKQISTRSQKLDDWTEEKVWSDRYKGLYIRITPRGKRLDNNLPSDFRIRYVLEGTPKGELRNIKITGADPLTITVSKAIAWYKDQSALLQQGVNPNKEKREARSNDEPTIALLGEQLLDPSLRFTPYAQATLDTYGSYLSSIIDRGCGTKKFSELTDSDVGKLIKDKNNDYALGFMSFIGLLEKRLPPQIKLTELFKVKVKRIYTTLPPRKNRLDVYLAYEDTFQQLAQMFLAMQYATNGYQIRKGSMERWHRIDHTWSDGLTSQQLEKADTTDDFHTEAQQDYFIKPTITNRAMTDAFLFIFLTGLRRKNVVEMKWADVNWEANVLIVPAIKGQIKKTQIPLTHYTKAILEYRNKHKKHGDVFVFPKKNTRQKLNNSVFSEQYRRIAVWACMLDYTDEYSNIRSLTKDRHNDKLEPETYKKNPLAPLLLSLGKDVTGETLDEVFPQLMTNLFRKCKESMKQADDKNLNVRCLIQHLGINPHGLRRTSANITRFIGRPQNIFLRHSGKTMDEKHYSSLSPEDERKYLSEVHNYIDNRLFESLGDENGYDEEKFVSPFLKYYEQPAVFKQDEYFDMSKHKRNPVGDEQVILDAGNALEELITELSNPKDNSDNDADNDSEF